MNSKLFLKIVSLSLVLMEIVNAHEQSMHQHITREAFNLLQNSFPGELTEMASYIGTNEVWSGGSADGSFGALRIVSGAWLEDEYDVVYHYGLGETPNFNQQIPVWYFEIGGPFFPYRDAFTSITHFWNSDGGISEETHLSDDLWDGDHWTTWSFNCENAYQKMVKYVNGNYNFLCAYRNGLMSWTWCGLNSLQLMTKFNIAGLIDLYNAEEDFQAIRYIGEDANWHNTSCPCWDTSYLLFFKAHAYEILGRMCHLIQDMSVPAHVHCTSHVGTYGMYSDYYENNASNFQMWTGDEIYNQGDQFICPYNSANDPIYYLMYFMNQIADHYADGKKNGDNNYDVNIPGLAEIIPYLGAPTNTSEINESNCQSMHDVLMPYAIRTTAGLLYWFGIETGTLVDSPPAIPQNFTGTWYNNHPKIYWTANTEPDFDHYEIWKKRGANWSLRTTTTNTSWVDSEEYKYTLPGTKEYVYYKIKAVDVANNKSDFTSQLSFAVNEWQQKKDMVDFPVVEIEPLPEIFKLHPAFPNPFNATTTLKLDLPEQTNFSLIIYDIKGTEVWSLNNRHTNSYSAGYHTFIWTGTDNNGNILPTGLYLTVFNSPDYKMSQKLVLVK